MKKFAVMVLVLALATMLTACGQSKSDKIWNELTKSVDENEITTIQTEDGSTIQFYTISESFR